MYSAKVCGHSGNKLPRNLQPSQYSANMPYVLSLSLSSNVSSSHTEALELTLTPLKHETLQSLEDTGTESDIFSDKFCYSFEYWWYWPRIRLLCYTSILDRNVRDVVFRIQVRSVRISITQDITLLSTRKSLRC